MKKLLMIFIFIALFCSMLSAGKMFDGKVIWTKHGTSKDSLGYFIIEKAGGVEDTFGIVDTSGVLTWYYSFGNLIFNGDTIVLQTAIDTIDIYMSNDTLYFDSRIGSAYLDLSEMIVLFGAGTMNLDDIQPATPDSVSSQIGSPANPYGNVWTANLKSTFFFQELFTEAKYLSKNSGENDYIVGGFTVFSSDSFVMDSLRMIYYTANNDVYIDSIAVTRGVTRTTSDNTLLIGDGTNVGSGSSGFLGYTYIVNATISFDWKLYVKFWVATSGVAGTGRIYSAKAYGHYYY